MKLIVAYIDGFKKAFISKKNITIIYGCTLMLGLILTGAFNAMLTSTISSRPEMYKLLHDFNYKIYSDFMNNYGDFIRPLINQMIWFGIFYFFFTIFFAGGILKYFEVLTIKSKSQAFFAGCAKYFWRFLRLGVYVILIQLAVMITIAVPFGLIFIDAVDHSPEPALFTIFLIWAGVHLLFFLLISIISDYAKIILVKEDSKKVLRTLLIALKFTLKKIYLTYPLYILLLVIPILLTFAYFWIDSILGMNTILTVILTGLIQQMFIWARMFSKVWILGSEYELFGNYLIGKTQPLLTQEMELDESL